jgi:hypothetical protein
MEYLATCRSNVSPEPRFAPDPRPRDEKKGPVGGVPGGA